MRHRRNVIGFALAGLFGVGAALACHDAGTTGPEVAGIDRARKEVPKNLTAVSVELIGPAPGEVDLGDPYNVRSPGQQQVWRKYEGGWMNLEARDFPVTLAFSDTDAEAMTDPDAPVQGECPVVNDWLFGNGDRVGLQERGELRGMFTFTFDGNAALLWYDIADPFGDGYTYHLSLSGSFGTAFGGDLTVTTETDGSTTFAVQGSTVSIGQWGHAKRDPYKRTKPAETPWCKLPLADFTLVVTE